MKLLTLLLPLLTAVVLVPTAVSRPLFTDPTPGPVSLGKPRSIGQASPFSPHPVQLDTNAKRFAKGLPPLAPSKSRRYKASPVRRTGASPLPPISSSGVIEVYNNNNGNRIGYISSVGTSGYQLQAARDSNTLRVHLTVPAGTTGTVTDVNVVAENSKLNNAANAPYVGILTSGPGTIGPNQWAAMAGTAQTSAGSRPVVGANTWANSLVVESAIWTVDVSTWSMTVKWINPDGNLAQASPLLSDTSLYFATANNFPTAPRISFKFVPDANLVQ